MRQDYWLEKLIQLRRDHLTQWKAFHGQEIDYRRELTRQHQTRKPVYTTPLERARLIQHQVKQILVLSQARKKRYELLKKHQAESLFELFQLKNSL